MKAAFIILWSLWGVFLVVQVIRGKPWFDLLTLVIILGIFFPVLARAGVPSWIVAALISAVHVVYFGTMLRRYRRAARPVASRE